LVEKKVIIELKSIRAMPAVATSQPLSNLKATGLRRALLINFGERHWSMGRALAKRSSFGVGGRGER
jgi:GxxExxY protein